jgi:hypothetical protein
LHRWHSLSIYQLSQLRMIGTMERCIASVPIAFTRKKEILFFTKSNNYGTR